MSAVQACELPQHALLRRYLDGGGFADCYAIDVAGNVTQADFVEAFYTSGLFKIERWILKVLAASPSTDAQARQLAAGQLTRFAAWTVESQTPAQLLLADVSARTRSWLMVSPTASPSGAPRTRLHFGSAVVPRPAAPGQEPRLGWPFTLLLGFHRLYSRLLLRAASRRLRPG